MLLTVSEEFAQTITHTHTHTYASFDLEFDKTNLHLKINGSHGLPH